MIVKVHIGGSRRGNTVFMYNEDRSFMYETDNQDEVREIISLMAPGESRAYFKAEIKNSKAILGEKVHNFKSK